MQFAEFELDRAAYQLRRKGRVVRLERIPLDLLLFLVEQRGQLVTREEIRNRIWAADLFLDTESSINTAIRKLRRVLRDRPGSPRFIETVPAKGYRFIAAVLEPVSQAIPIRQSEIAFTHEESKANSVAGSQTGERRYVTVLVCELMNSNSPAAQPDPEEWWENVADFYRSVAHVIERYGGHAGPNRGDAMMAYFGWPQAHDNNAENAVRAGLAILDEIAQLDPSIAARLSFSPRIGIHSGAVVVGAGSSRESDIFGDTPGVAVQVQGAAAPGTLVITAATNQLVCGLFVIEDCGTRPLKGFARPVNVYRVLRPTRASSRLDAAAGGGGLTSFVGRKEELRLLMSRWERILDGEGQVALVVGEPGIGKSRLVHRFREELVGISHRWTATAAKPFFRTTPFYPVEGILRQFLAWCDGESVEKQMARLESVLTAEAIPLIAPLLSSTIAARYPPSSLSSEQQRRRLLATLVDSVLCEAHRQPLVIVIEDLHWADPSTLELIQLLASQVAAVRLLLLLTARPEFHAQWPPRAHHTNLTLNRLSARDARTMVSQLASRMTLSDETVAAVVERTGGVPLFVEELTRVVVESGDATLIERGIPLTLHDSLMARLDRLGSAKEIAKIGAVIGGEFSYELLHEVHPVAEEDLRNALGDLVDAELVYERGIAPQSVYRFKHALIRDAAYEALLRSRRKELHRKVAQTLDKTNSGLKERPEVVARHWTEAGEIERAIAEWSRAGKAAEKGNAFIEAFENYQQAVTLIKLLPESPQRDLRELEIEAPAVDMLHLTKGWAAPETVEACARYQALAEKTGQLIQLGDSLASRAFTAWAKGELAGATALADRALELALREGNPATLAHRYMLQLAVRHHGGDLAGTEEYFTAGGPFFDDPIFRRGRLGGAVAVFGWATWNAWTIGRADLAREREARMMAVVNSSNLHDVVFAAIWSIIFRASLHEFRQVEVLATRALELSEKHQFPHHAGQSRCALGLARAHLGHPIEGLRLIRRGLGDLIEIGSRGITTRYFMYLAEAQQCAEAYDDALGTIEEALNCNPLQLVHRPEGLRIRGELRFKQAQLDLAQADFNEAIALAQRMGAKALQLRASMGLARVLAHQRRRDEAHSMLSEIHGWFTEGFDTADLKEAKALLEDIQRPS